MPLPLFVFLVIRSHSLVTYAGVNNLYKVTEKIGMDGRHPSLPPLLHIPPPSPILFTEILTLRRLMSYIYMEPPFLMFLDHTQRRSTVGRTPLDE